MIPDLVDIDQRHKHVDDKKEIGHWKGDTVYDQDGYLVALTKRDIKLLLLFPVSNFFISEIWIRRIIFSVIYFPTCFRIWFVMNGVIKSAVSECATNFIIRFLLLLSLVIYIVLGFYLPPFFDGISGWYLEKENPKEYEFVQIRIFYKDGSWSWFKTSFFNPITQKGGHYE